MASSAPADIASSSSPSRPAVRSSASRAAGTRANHDADGQPVEPEDDGHAVAGEQHRRDGGGAVSGATGRLVGALTGQVLFLGVVSWHDRTPESAPTTTATPLTGWTGQGMM